MAFDVDRAQELALDVWKFKQGEVVSMMVHIGDRLGIYRAMAGHGPRPAGTIAAACGLNARWTEEWLLGQAAAGLIDRDAGGHYALTDEAAAVLVDEESLFFAAGAFAGGTPPQNVEMILDGFRTGRGFSYGEMGEASAEQIDRMNGPWLRNYLVPEIISRLDGVSDRLQGGGRIADVGCGGGVALQALSVAFPEAELVGVDPSAPAVALARSRFGDNPRVVVRQAGVAGIADDGPFDLVTTLDCMHDMPRPDEAAATIRECLAPEGVWLIKDMKASADFESNLRNPLLAMQYGYSILSCLPSATATPDGMGLGTLGFHPERAKQIVTDAGFTSIRMIGSDDPAHLYYEVRH